MEESAEVGEVRLLDEGLEMVSPEHAGKLGAELLVFEKETSEGLVDIDRGHVDTVRTLGNIDRLAEELPGLRSSTVLHDQLVRVEVLPFREVKDPTCFR